MMYVFDNCELDTHLYILHRNGRRIELRPKVFQVLTYLLDHCDRVVPKQELAEQIWPEQFISNATLESCIRMVRQAIGDSGREQRLIQTRHGHGYRFVGIVTVRSEEQTSTMGPAGPSSHAPATEGAGGDVATDSRAFVSAPKAVTVDPSPQGHTSRCHACQHPNQSATAFCVECGTQLVHPCGHCGYNVRLPAMFCAACGRRLEAMVSPGIVSPGVRIPAAPSHLQPPLVSAAQTGERKVITVLCCRLKATPQREVRIDLDALHNQMRALYDLARPEMQQYGGTIPYVTGDRFLALFGVPMAQEDHAQRAVLAALALQQKVLERKEVCRPPGGEDVAVSIGLHTGTVAVGGIGQEQEITAAVVGDTAFMATALQEMAVPGTILCSAAVARLLQGMIQVEPTQPVTVPGQSGQVAVYKILGREAGRGYDVRPGGRALRRFVGRRRELAALRTLLAQVAVGRGHVVGIVGDPGIGKSRVLNEFRQQVVERPITYLEGRCLSYSRGTPYRPILDLCRQACDLTESDSSEVITAHVHRYLQDIGMALEENAPYLLHLLGVHEGTEQLLALSPQALKIRTFAMLRHLCICSSQRQPLIIIVEDLHWIDATSEEWLMSLVEGLVGVPILLLGTYRPGCRPPWMDKSYATQLSLQPLTLRESRRIVQEIFSSIHVPEPLVQRLLVQAEGNPFFLEELAYTVLEYGVDSQYPVVPDTIQAVLTARIDRLPATEKRLLQIAAVIGKDIPLSLLEAIADLPKETLLQVLERLQAAEFLYETRLLPTSTYTFKHVLTQEVAYRSLLHSTRQPYHQQIAQVLAERFPETADIQPELLAHHYTEAGLSEQAVPYWEQAGRRAMARSANIEAISHLKKGLEALATLPATPERDQQELRLQLALGPPLLMSRGHTAPEVEHTYARAYELCQQVGENPQLFSVLVGLWRFYMSQARLRTAYELGEQCFLLAQQASEPALLQEAHMMLGATLFYLGEPLSAHTHLEQGATLYDLQQDRSRAFSRSNDPGVLCLSLDAWTLWILGYPDRALARSNEALALARKSSRAYNLGFALHFASTLHTWRREVQLVKEHSEAVIALSNEHGFVRWLGGGMVKRGWILAEQGAADEGIEQLLQGLATWQAMGGELGLPSILVKLAEAYGKGGQTERGLQVLAEAMAVVNKNGERYYEAELYRLQGEFLLLQDAAYEQQAEHSFHQALDIARHQQTKAWELRIATSLGRLWRKQGKRQEASQMLAGIYHWFTEGFDTPDLQEAKVLLETLV